MRKNLLILTGLIMVLCLNINAQPEVVAWYPLDATEGDTAADLSTNEYDAPIEGTIAWSAGTVGNCLEFDGTTRMALPGWDMGLTSNNGSVSLWVNSADPSNIYTLFWAGDNNTGGGFGPEHELHLQLESVDDPWIGGEASFWAYVGYDPTTDKDTGTHVFTDPGKGWSPGGTPSAEVVVVDDEEWHHVVITWGLYLSIWVDNVELWTKPYSSPGFSLDTMYVGQMADGKRAFSGKLDEIVIFDKAISAIEIADLFAKEPPVSVESKYNTHKLRAYPNPAVDGIYVNFDNASQSATVSIMNIAGQTLLTKLNVVNGQYLDISSLENGLYVLKLDDGRQTSYTKFLVK